MHKNKIKTGICVNTLIQNKQNLVRIMPERNPLRKALTQIGAVWPIESEPKLSAPNSFYFHLKWKLMWCNQGQRTSRVSLKQEDVTSSWKWVFAFKFPFQPFECASDAFHQQRIRTAQITGLFRIKAPGMLQKTSSFSLMNSGLSWALKPEQRRSSGYF